VVHSAARFDYTRFQIPALRSVGIHVVHTTKALDSESQRESYVRDLFCVRVIVEIMILTASKLRESIYRVLDHALKTGEVIEIERNGRRLRIVPDEPRSRIERLAHRPNVVVGDPEDFVHLDWSSEWKP
jgi:hypothetical protein